MPTNDAARWRALLDSFDYAVWENFVEPAAGNEPVARVPAPRGASSPSFQLPWRDACAALAQAPYLLSRQGDLRRDRILRSGEGAVRVPHRLDSADFGNELVYAAIGCYDVEDRPDLSRLIKLCGPDKRDIPISPPHYDLPGGPAYRKIETSRIVLFGMGGRLFRGTRRQRQRRLRGAPVWVTELDAGSSRVTIVDFAPLAPALSLVCRVFLVQEEAGRSPLPIDQLFVNSASSWTADPLAGALMVRDRSDGTGICLRSWPSLQVGSTNILADQPEAPWQAIDVMIAPRKAGTAGLSVAWSLFVPTISGGDPAERAALDALTGFDPFQSIIATIDAWKTWASEVSFRSDSPLLDDLVNGLALLLKVHEGRHGMHLGTTYQRHTHCWIRDNYLMQRGLWAAGRAGEAARDVGAFAGYWKENGPALGYHVASRRSWSPQVTAELCSYLVLMGREAHRWTARAPEGDARAMVLSCADAIAMNRRGLAGFDGDEAWFWELDPRLFLAGDARLAPPDFSVLDNCWLALAALEYAAALADRVGESSMASRWKAKERSLRENVDALLWDPAAGHYSALLFPDGTPYGAPLVSGLCTPWFWGVAETRPGSYAAGVDWCERILMTPEGILRGNADTDVFAGLTPSFHLHALGRMDGTRFDAGLAALIRALPSSGACWEYATFDCPVTGSDKRRGLDSGVLLAALLDGIVGFRPSGEGFALQPRTPGICRGFSFGEMPFQGRLIAVEADEAGTRVRWDGKPRWALPPGSRLRWRAEDDWSGI